MTDTTLLHQGDALHRFLFEFHPVRGELVRLDRTWRTVQARRHYPAPVRRALGEALAATALLRASVKFEGNLTLQLQSDGPLRLLLVQSRHGSELRALARWHEVDEEAGFDALCGTGNLAVTIEPDQGRERYQGLVEIDPAGIGPSLERYFARSEQLPTRLLLTASSSTAAGLLLQRLPGESLDPDAWNRIVHLGTSVTREELLGTETATLLRRLFHEETVRLFNAQPLAFHCDCSRQRTAAMLVGLGADEARSILAEQGRVTVTCQFCGLDYVFDAVDIAQLFADGAQPDTRDILH